MAEALRREKEFSENIINSSVDGILAIDLNYNYTLWNPGMERISGAKKSQVLGKCAFDVFPHIRETGEDKLFYDALQGKVSVAKEKPFFIKKTGRAGFFEGHYAPLYSEPGVIEGAFAIIRDVTERKKAEDALRQSEKKYATLVESGNDGIVIIQDGLLKFANTQVYNTLGFSPEEVIGKPFTQFLAPGDIDLVSERYRRRVAGEDVPGRYEARLLAKDGREIMTELSANVIEYEGRPADMAIIRDITERKKAEDALGESEERYRSTLDGMMEGCQIIGFDWRYIYVNDALAKQGKRTKEELLGHTMMEMYPGIEDTELFTKLQDCMNKRISHQMENLFTFPDGSKGWFELRIAPVPEGIFILSIDITERKRAEEALTNEAIWRRILIEQSRDGIVVLDQNGKVYEANQKFVEMLGYSPEEVLRLHIWDWDTQWSKEQLRSMIRDVGEAGAQFETRHRRKDGTICDVEISTNGATFGGKKLVFCVCRDITEHKKAEESLEKSYATLKKTLSDAVNTMAKIVEMRDPYTAGHQQRVTQLAVAIAKELNLDTALIETLCMAAVIHDIGKIYVPSDILNKPGKLSGLEFEIIKTHPQGGYDIVKGMEFPNVIAETILQHHERLDGSGYPRRLEAKDIIKEAKIMAVADVVEAMATHRPYRPALGIDKALEEISQHKGMLYDAEVVEACIRLFKEKGFDFE
jgi:PAS domain S-box-containing protein/putative nucleotidyltransferase with HDIG domain